MTAGSPLRRGVLAIMAVGIAGYLLRPQLAQALVVRGDEQLYASRPRDALRYYARAIALSPRDPVAVDRFLFVAATLRDAGAVKDGIRLASAYLRYSDDVSVRMDRAMAYRVLGASAESLADFERVGYRTKDPVALTFGGLAARRLGLRRRAVALFRAALAVQPRFAPAAHALQRLKASQ